MTLIEIPGPHLGRVQGRASGQRFLLGMAAVEEATSGILRRSEVQDRDRPLPEREHARDAGKGRFVDHLEDGGMIIARMAQDVPSKPLKLLGWVIPRGFEAVANRMNDVDDSAGSRAVGTSLDDLDRLL